jgi:uncharacterized membrane protein
VKGRLNTVIAVLVLGAVSALVYAAAAVAQRSAATRAAEPGGPGLSRSGVWWLSVLLNALGALLHTAALRYGSLVAVQMLGVLTLVAAPLLSAGLLRRRMSATQWWGTALTVAGVAALLVLARSAGTGRTANPGELLGVVLLTSAVLGVAAAAAAVAGRTMTAGLWYAAAAGAAFAAASALAQVAVVELTGPRGAGGGPNAPVMAVLVLAGVACLAPAGLGLCQLAYRGGLEAPLATVTLVNPLFAALIGVLLGDRYSMDTTTVLTGLAAALAAGRGVLLLARAEAEQRGEATRSRSPHPLGRRPASATPAPPARSGFRWRERASP